jgi:hypothetical protein
LYAGFQTVQFNNYIVATGGAQGLPFDIIVQCIFALAAGIIGVAKLAEPFKPIRASTVHATKIYDSLTNQTNNTPTQFAVFNTRERFLPAVVAQ